MIVNGVELTHVDALLTDFAIGYRPTGFIADMIFPVIDVPKQSDVYAIFDQEDRFRQWHSIRAPGDMANEIRMKTSSDQFHCKNYALSNLIPDELVANADPIFRQSLEEVRTSFVLDALMLDWDKRVADLITATTGVGSSAAVSSSWSDNIAGNSDPVGDINTAIDNVQDATGYKPNRAVCGIGAWRTLRRHDDIIDKSTNPNVSGGGNYPRTVDVARLFDLDEIIVGGAYLNNAQEGLALDLQKIWNDHFIVYYNNPQPKFDAPTYAVTFNWRSGPMPRLAVQRFAHDDERGAQKVQAGFYQDERLVATALSFMVQSVNF